MAARPPDFHGSGAEDEAPGLLVRLRERTHALHVDAERSGFISELLKGRGTRDRYALLLRNLLPAYRELEHGLDRHGATQIFESVRWKHLYRRAAIERDLLVLAGPGWTGSVALLPSGLRYASAVARAASGNGERLIAHAYTRYLGDLSGGQILKRLLGRSLGLGPEALSFYDFPAIADIAGFKSEFRDGFGAAAKGMADVEAVVEEAATAFRLNIELSEEIQAAASSS